MPSPSPLFHVAGTPPVRLRIVRPLDVLTQGSHHPLVCAMEHHEDGASAGQWVVKQQVVLSAVTSYGAFSTVAELAGAEVCAWVGLAAPAVGLTTFPASLDEPSLRSAVATLEPPKRDEIIEVYRANLGRLAFCARLVWPSTDLLPSAFTRKPRHRDALLADLAALLVADAFMIHTDREASNPNALRYQEQTVAIDHNLAFAVLAQAGQDGPGAARRSVPPREFKRHVVGKLVGKDADDPHLGRAIARLEQVTDAQIDALIATWPRDLDSEPSRSISRIFERFRLFMKERRSHVREFVVQACAMLHGPP